MEGPVIDADDRPANLFVFDGAREMNDRDRSRGQRPGREGFPARGADARLEWSEFGQPMASIASSTMLANSSRVAPSRA